MAWGDIDRAGRGSGGAGRFVQFESGVTLRLRVLDEEPHTTRVHKISQVQGGQEVFRSIPATAKADDNFILKRNGKRYPDTMQFNMRAWVYALDDKKRPVAEGGEIRILQGGPAIFKQLREIYNNNGHLNGYDITITRSGEGRDTEYAVSASPKSFDLNVAEVTQAMESDEAWKWENVFPPVTEEDQIRMLSEAGLDIDYDPAAAMADSMSFDEAKIIKFTFGKHKDKSVGDVLVTDAGYVEWASENVTTNDQLAAACRVAAKHMATIGKGNTKALPKADKPAEPPKKADAPKADKPEPKKAEDSKKRGELLEEVQGYFEAMPRFEDVAEMVNVIKKHGGGKTRLKDLTVAQLDTLLVDIKSTVVAE
jgi:hypothetical protein